MNYFKFYWDDGYDDPFPVQAENAEHAVEVFKVEWEAWIQKLMGYPQNNGKTREELEFETVEKKLADGYSVREVGDDSIKWNPRPVCCDRINEIGRYHDKPPAILQVARRNPESGDYFTLIDPHWVLRKSGDEVTFCPFCGTKLPEVEKMENPPQPLWDGDDDYCVTCSERNMCCECNPPWTAYRVRPSS